MRYLTERSRSLDCDFLRKVELNAPLKTHESFIYSYIIASTWINQIWDFRIWIGQIETKRALLQTCFLLRNFQINAVAINYIYYINSHIFIPINPNLRSSIFPNKKRKFFVYSITSKTAHAQFDIEKYRSVFLPDYLNRFQPVLQTEQ